MAYAILNRTDRDKWVPRRGLEGPFFYPCGRVTYYDPIEGAYWDPTTDFYLSYEEQTEFQNTIITAIRNSN